MHALISINTISDLKIKKSYKMKLNLQGVLLNNIMK